VRLAPIAVFALFAVTVGTTAPRDLANMSLYLALFLLGTVLRPDTAKMAPCAASARAVAYPIPLDAPVMSTFLPRRSIRGFLLLARACFSA
jgi:hypothetical protein